MKNISAVALNTFREAVRDRVLYNLVFFALLMMGAAILVGQISIGIEEIVIDSLGLSAISFIGLLMAIFIGVGLVSKELDKRTIYALLSKPVRRWEFLVGKFAGLVFTLAVNTAAMSAGLFAALLYVRHSLQRSDAYVLVAVYFILLKLAIVVALALLFSCSTTSLLSILYCAGLYIAGSFVEQMRTLRADLAGHTTVVIMRWLSYILPNFENFSVTGSVAHGVAIPHALILQNTLYAALYCAVVLAATSVIFSFRNLK
jgi:ABC-type transport system involved in multi-copper enzyme maturation permease subunit